MKKRSLTPMDIYRTCYSISPDIRASKISKLVFALKDQSLDYGKE
mgnify:CR=1 FL=1|jgi:hypothetical protein